MKQKKELTCESNKLFCFVLIYHVLYKERELYLSKYQITSPSKSQWEWFQPAVLESGKPVYFHYPLIYAGGLDLETGIK